MIEPPDAGQRRFGAFSGVFTPSILTILGVIMYLRFGWVVGNVGLGGALVIVALSHAISVSTALSVSSIATNRTVKTGGAYFMISRSLGAPVGAAVGIPLFFAQAISITLYVVGFVESLALLAPSLDARWVGTAVCLALTVLSMIGADLAIKAQYFIMAAIGLSLLSFFFGGSPTAPDSVAWTNPQGAPFAEVFGVFFPAVTGIMAGVSMSGDLRDPRRDLPRGTMAATLAGLVIYTAIPIWMAMNSSLDRLATDLDVFWDLSSFPAAIYAGVWGATLSSALGSIMAAPRTLQALALDGMVPRLLGRGYGRTNEPRVGIVVTFLLAEIGILFGNLDAIAQVLTMLFLVTYGMTNLACGLEKWAASPSFRPSFSVPWWLSVFGAAASFYVMSIIDLMAMMVSLGLCGIIYAVAVRRAPASAFSDARHGIWAALVRTALQKLKRTEFHAINWRPNLLVLGGNVVKRPYLLEIGNALVQDRGVMTFFCLLEGEIEEMAPTRQRLQPLFQRQCQEIAPRSFCRVEVVSDLYRGMVTTAQSYGVGTFETNTVLLGWPVDKKRREACVAAVRDLLALERSVLIARFDEERGFGLRRRVDVWWGGLQNNGALMLLTSFLIASHPAWRDARVRVLTVVGSSDLEDAVRSSLVEVLMQSRVEAEAHVLVRNQRSIAEIMRGESRDTDLAVLGLRVPSRAEDVQEFYDRQDEMLEALPTVLMVASPPSFQGAPVLFDSDASEAVVAPSPPVDDEGTPDDDRRETG